MTHSLFDLLALWIGAAAIWMVVARRLGLTTLGFALGFAMLALADLAVMVAFLKGVTP